MNHPIRRQISPYVARLRQDMTDAERLLWTTLRNRQLSGFKFRRQATIDHYVVDVLCVEASLIVELNGGQHTPERDKARTQELEAKGLQVLRFWNNEAIENLDGVLTRTLAVALERTAKAREGSRNVERGLGM